MKAPSGFGWRGFFAFLASILRAMMPKSLSEFEIGSTSFFMVFGMAFHAGASLEPACNKAIKGL